MRLLTRRRRSRSRQHLPPAELLECRALLTASVEQAVQTGFEYFENREEFSEFLIQQSLQRYESYYGEPAWYPLWPGIRRPDIFSALTDNDGHGSTNNQISGVDEADLIENDGDHLYLISGGDLLIVDASPAEKMNVASRLDLEGTPTALFLHNRQLTVVSSTYPPVVAFDFLDAPHFWKPQTTVTTFDVWNPASPELTQQTSFDGHYLDSRMIDGRVHVITSNSVALPAPRQVPVADESPAPPATRRAVDGAPTVASLIFAPPNETHRYETKDSYEAWLRENIDRFVDDAMPEYSMKLADGSGTSGLISDFHQIAAQPDETFPTMTSVLTIDTTGQHTGLAGSTSVFNPSYGTVHATTTSLYMATHDYQLDTTQILKFAWAGPTENTRLIASGQVPGRLRQQFALDEYQGHLRVATTTRGDGEMSNNVYVLEEAEGQLNQIGAVEGFGERETIHSVRFSGDRAFVVTFRLIDPLFMIDLADPTSPVITGELEVPGFSTYLHRIDDEHLLAVGRIDVGSAGRFRLTSKVSLYDIGDPTNPTLVDEEVLPDYTWTLANTDHHAFGWHEEHSILAIPTSSYGEHALAVFDVNPELEGEDAIQLLGEVDNSTPVIRSTYIGDVLYSVSHDSVVAVEARDPSTELGRVEGLRGEHRRYKIPRPLILTRQNGGDPLAVAESRTSAVLRQEDQRLEIQLPEDPVRVTIEGETLTITTETGSDAFDLQESVRLNLTGTEGDNVVALDFGGAAPELLSAFSIQTLGGNDEITLEQISEEGVTGELFGGRGHDTITVAPEIASRQKIFGGGGNDTLSGGSGNDLLNGGSGSDQLTGGTGNDRLVGMNGRDVLRGQDGDDTINGGRSHDRLYGGRGEDILRGGRGNDRIHGSNGNDSLAGNSGDDLIHGNFGDDTLLDVWAAVANDRFLGGPGRDRFLTAQTDPAEILDRLFDFTPEDDWLTALEA